MLRPKMFAEFIIEQSLCPVDYLSGRLIAKVFAYLETSDCRRRFGRLMGEPSGKINASLYRLDGKKLFPQLIIAAASVTCQALESARIGPGEGAGWSSATR